MPAKPHTFDQMPRIVALEAENAGLRAEAARLGALLARTSAGRDGEPLPDLTTLLDNLPAPVSYWDRDMRNRYANRAYLDWFGTTAQQLCGQSIRQAIGEARYRLNLPHIQGALRGERRVVEHAAAAEDGAQMRHFKADYIPDIDNGVVRGFFVLVSDITRLREADADLRASEERYRSVVEDQTEVISRLRADGTFIVVNEVYCRYFGRSAHELLGSRWHPVVHPDDIAMVEAKVNTLSADNPLVVIENRVYSGTGEVRWMEFTNRGFFDSEGRLREIQSVGRDVTARRLAEDQLRISEERLRLVADVTGSGIWDWDLRTGLAHLTPRYYEITGYAPGQVRPDFEFFRSTVHPDDWPHVQATMEAHLRGETVASEFDYRLVTATGELKWAEGKGSVVERDVDGSPLRMVGTITDITARKLALEELHRSRAELQALAARLESVREEERRRIAREIHDELGQTLTALRMDAIWLQDRMASGNRSMAAKAGEMAASLGGALEAVRRISQETHSNLLEALGLAAAIEWQVAEFRKRMGIRCVVALPSGPVAASAELGVHVFRICQELLTNIARHAGANRVDVSLALEGGAVLLIVADNGRGIAATHTDGKSLGLVSVRERAAHLAGTVEILTSPVIQGTRVTVRVPLARAPTGRDNA